MLHSAALRVSIGSSDSAVHRSDSLRPLCCYVCRLPQVTLFLPDLRTLKSAMQA